MDAYEAARINPEGEFPRPLPIAEAAAVVAKFDAYTENETDRVDRRQWTQLKGQFLIDRDGVVRWSTLSARPRAWLG